MRNFHPIGIEDFLSRTPLFSGLEPADISRISGETRAIHSAKGDTLFHRGDPCEGLHIVVFGQIKLSFFSAQGNEKVVDIINQGQSFGEALMFMGKPYMVSAQALSESHLLYIPRHALFKDNNTDIPLSMKMLAGLAAREYELLCDLEDYAMHSGTQRLIGYLLREIDDEGDETTEISLSTTKAVIASRLNLTQEHFSRLLNELARQGLIVVDGKKITVPSVTRLRQLMI